MPMATPLRRRVAALGRDAAVVAAVTLGLVLAVELFLRVFSPQDLRGTSLRGERFSEPDSLLGLRYIPEAVWRFDHPEYSVEYAINREGFRDATERPAAKPPGTLRVLLLGDSFTFGQGADYAETWPVVAARSAPFRAAGRVDLINAGMQGLDTRSELVLLRRLAQRYDVDAVVLAFMINDVYTNVPLDAAPAARPAQEEPAWTAVRRTVFRRHTDTRTFHLFTLAQRALISSDAAYVALYLAAPARGEYLTPPLPPSAQRRLAVTERLLKQVAAYCDSIGKPLFVLSLPQQFQVLYPPKARPGSSVDVAYYDRYFEARAAAGGYEWIPTLEPFIQAAAGGTRLFHRLDGHFTAAGHAVVAEAFNREALPHITALAPPAVVFGGGRSEP